MGRLPVEFVGRRISFRLPYSMPGELSMTASQSGQTYPDATFLHNIDKPFEIHRINIRLTGFDSGGLMFDPPPTSLERRIRIRINDVSKNEILTKAAHEVATLLNDQSKSWEFEEPYTVVRSEGFQISLDSQAFTYTPWGISEADTLTTIRVEIAFQGYLVVVAPPSETR